MTIQTPRYSISNYFFSSFSYCSGVIHLKVIPCKMDNSSERIYNRIFPTSITLFIKRCCCKSFISRNLGETTTISSLHIICHIDNNKKPASYEISLISTIVAPASFFSFSIIISCIFSRFYNNNNSE